MSTAWRVECVCINIDVFQQTIFHSLSLEWHRVEDIVYRFNKSAKPGKFIRLCINIKFNIKVLYLPLTHNYRFFLHQTPHTQHHVKQCYAFSFWNFHQSSYQVHWFPLRIIRSQCYSNKINFVSHFPFSISCTQAISFFLDFSLI